MPRSVSARTNRGRGCASAVGTAGLAVSDRMAVSSTAATAVLRIERAGEGGGLPMTTPVHTNKALSPYRGNLALGSGAAHACGATGCKVSTESSMRTRSLDRSVWRTRSSARYATFRNVFVDIDVAQGACTINFGNVCSRRQLESIRRGAGSAFQGGRVRFQAGRVRLKTVQEGRVRLKTGIKYSRVFKRDGFA